QRCQARWKAQPVVAAPGDYRRGAIAARAQSRQDYSRRYSALVPRFARESGLKTLTYRPCPDTAPPARPISAGRRGCSKTTRLIPRPGPATQSAPTGGSCGGCWLRWAWPEASPKWQEWAARARWADRSWPRQRESRLPPALHRVRDFWRWLV